MRLAVKPTEYLNRQGPDKKRPAGASGGTCKASRSRSRLEGIFLDIGKCFHGAQGGFACGDVTVNHGV